MKLFKKRNNRILDLSERYKKQQARAEEMKQEVQESRGLSENNAGGLGFFGAIANSVSQNNSVNDLDYVKMAPKGVPSVEGDINTEGNEKRRRLAKRLMEMTNKIEELSNQIYHLQQRIEVLERKSGVGY